MIENADKNKIMIIAGEISGDLIGASLIRELKKLNGELVVCGIGGDRMKAGNTGARSRGVVHGNVAVGKSSEINSQQHQRDQQGMQHGEFQRRRATPLSILCS